MKVSLLGPLLVITFMILVPKETAFAEIGSDVQAHSRATVQTGSGMKIVNTTKFFGSITFNDFWKRATSVD